MSMLRFCIIIAAIVTVSPVKAQVSDFIILKKRNRTVQMYYAGNNIEFVTTGGAYRDGLINRISNDTIFMQEFIVRRLPTTFGTYILDTAGSFRYAYHYNQVKAFGKEQKGFNVQGSGAALLGGGILLTLASGISYVADKDKFSPGLLGAAVGLGTLGYFMSRSGSKGTVIGKKGYRLQYMSVQNK